MEAKIHKSSVTIVDIAVIMGWIPSSSGGPNRIGCAHQATLARPVQMKSTKDHEIIVRFGEGSSRVIKEGNLPTRRLGERVKVISEVIQSHD